ncbi:hypothetical protein [Streptomyces sp. NPDC002057]|uniref:hypothetical protein n=1 Tax=Streptomyces sp. NPDC002057 TaxID=3154664 RepID=UPI00331E8E3E
MPIDPYNGAAQDTVLMPAVTFDVLTGLVVVAALVLARLVYQWTALTPNSPAQTSRGERLVYAVGTAASVVVLGSYLVGGFRGIQYAQEPAAGKPAAAAPVLSEGEGVAQELRLGQ